MPKPISHCMMDSSNHLLTAMVEWKAMKISEFSFLSVILKLVFASAVFAAVTSSAPPHPHGIPGNRVASVYISQDFINGQLAAHAKSDLLKELKIALSP